MNLRIQYQGQMDTDPAANINRGASSTGPSGEAKTASLNAFSATDDTASISAATTQLSGDMSIRQDRVDALRMQVESGTYVVNAHAVATAMFQNLFRSRE